MLDIRFSSLSEKVIEAFKKAPEKVTVGLVVAVDKSALLIQNSAKIYAPVKTGHLRRSITKQVVPGSKGLAQAVGTDVVYARIQEYGGRTGRNNATFLRAQPYLRPALARNKSKIRNIFEKEAANALKFS